MVSSVLLMMAQQRIDRTESTELIHKTEKTEKRPLQ